VTEAAGWDGLGVTIAEVADRLGEQRRPPGGGAPYTLSGVLNLVAYAPEPGDLGPMREVIEGLADHQASRTILISEAGEGGGLDAAVSTSCRLAGDSTTLALELVELTIHRAAHEGVASACMPLLRSELPTVLWWPTAPGGALAGLLPLADRVVTEAGRGRDAAAAVRALADWLPGDDGPAVTDLAWAGVTPWRQLIVQVLDRDSLEALRPGAEAAIVHAAPAPDAGALLMAGWLEDYLGEAAAIELRPREDPGHGVLAVEVAGPAGRRLAVERLPGRDAATVTVTAPDGTVRSRTLPLPDHGRARLLAGELEIQRRDRAFERALARAAR
jgi:glucose-6-phosphate dehydrogenase assembly protein OpcA